MADWHLWLPPALTKRRFRLYTVGHTISVTGGWIQQVALAWLVFRLTNSIFLLGLTGFLLNIFYLLLGPVAGLAADRLPRLPALIVIDVVLAGLSGWLALMGLAGVENISAYLAVAALIGIANAFEMPIRQTLFKDIVEDRALVTSAIGVSAMVFNVGRMLGPAIAGVLLAYISEAWCFAINALSFVAIIGALIAMRLPRASAPAASGGRPEGFWANLGALLSFPAVRYLLPTVVAVGLFATPYVPLMPSIVAHFFDGRSSTVGILMSAAGLGALASATYLSLQPGYGRQIRLVTAAPLAVGFALVAFSWSRTLPLSLLLLAALGASVLVSVNATNALLQQSVPDAWRGRAVGLYSMSFAGTAPIGNIVTGSLAERIGLTATLSLNGALIVAAGLFARWRLHNHPEALRGLMRSLSR
ncbi:MAG TPA: MFS transporter [Hyphomicrobiaceae bacterium]|nr:MFS transporter [Hyphomicrobiaceae bacterium]